MRWPACTHRARSSMLSWRPAWVTSCSTLALRTARSSTTTIISIIIMCPPTHPHALCACVRAQTPACAAKGGAAAQWPLAAAAATQSRWEARPGCPTSTATSWREGGQPMQSVRRPRSNQIITSASGGADPRRVCVCVWRVGHNMNTQATDGLQLLCIWQGLPCNEHH